MKRFFIALFGALLIAAVMPVSAQSTAASMPSASTSSSTMHRYMVKRTFPAGALSKLDMATKNKVNATNAKFHVKWVRSYANADKTLTFCVYDGPSEQAIRAAAKANGLPVDDVFEVPVTLMPHSKDIVSAH